MLEYLHQVYTPYPFWIGNPSSICGDVLVWSEYAACCMRDAEMQDNLLIKTYW
jgi:hypothetical protein